MTIEITRWQPLFHDGNGVASFNFRVGAITVRAAMFQRTSEGFRVTMPFSRHKQSNGKDLLAVGLDYDLLREVTDAAEDYYHKNGNRWSYPRDANVRLVQSAEAETCELAGL